MKIGLISTAGESPEAGLADAVAELKQIDSENFPFISMPNIFGLDAITTIALAGRETRQLEMATGVVPTPPRHPAALAQQALTTQEACGGRFTLGIGLSHKLVIEDMFGLSYAKPASQMREYLEVLMPLLEGKPASHQGEHYRVNAGLQVPAGVPVPVLVAALGPRMLEVAGQLAHGTSTWMTGLTTLANHIVPTINAAANGAGRSQPRVLASIPVVLTTDEESAREKCNKAFAIYPTLPSYKAMLDREGVGQPAEIALIGDETVIREGIDRFRDAGVTDFAASIFPAGPGSTERTREFLRSLL
ncbi:MAG: TIGR03564 family F420-dependent LLM class oxidoreductase [Myxococcota bacterium]|jgi:5,10-methylenetetrahydromethanopterin reductase|nr:TIGR03564 family F420-dependent LLM class oxidoreductase [Myxococcota bacterium]